MKFCAIFLLLVMLPARVFCSAVETIEPEFSSVVPEDAALYQVAGGLQFTEGPVWVEGKDGQGQGYLLFSDIPADRIYRWDDPDKLSVWRTPSGKSNGLLLDSRGRVLACEHWNRRVSLYLAPDSVVALCTSYSGGALNSPNDIAIGPEGALWFTDPPYGLEGRKKEQAGNFVFRLSPGETEPEVMVSDFERPNGIVFSPDKTVLYISDSQKRHVRVFSVTGDSLEDKGIFTGISPGGPDGMCVDVAGRVYVTAGDGVQVFSPKGTLLGKILTPEKPTNCCFGGRGWKTLFITARPDVYAIRLKVKGLP